MVVRSLLVVLASVLAASPALAEMSFRLGLASNQSDTFSTTFTDGGASGRIPGVKMETGTQLSLAAGRAFDSWRLELELFRQFDTATEGGEVLVAPGNGSVDVDLYGTLQATGLMVNGYLDLATNPEARLRPWLSAGVGLARLEMRGVTMIDGGGGTLTMEPGEVTELAWRAGLGLAWHLTSGAVVDLGLLRYDYGTAESSKSGFSTGIPGPVSADEPLTYGVSGLSWSLSLRRPF